MLDRYLLSTFLKNWLFILMIIMGIYYTVGILELILRADVKVFSLVKYFFYLSTEIFMQISGIVSVLAISVTLLKLEKTKELLICQSFGNTLIRTIKPIIWLSFLLSVVTLCLLTFVNPVLLKKAKRIYYEEVWSEKIPLLSLSSDKIWYESNNFIFNLNSVGSEGKSGKGLSLYKFSSNWELEYFIKAKSVQFIPKDAWKLSQGFLYQINSDDLVTTQAFASKIITESPKIKQFNYSIEFYKYMNSLQLYHFMQNNKNLGLNTIRYEIEYYSRFLLSFSGLLLLFVFIPFSLGPFIGSFNSYNKNSLGIVISILYWFIYTGSVKLALISGSVILIAVPFLLFLILGIFLWKKIKI